MYKSSGILQPLIKTQLNVNDIYSKEVKINEPQMSSKKLKMDIDLSNVHKVSRRSVVSLKASGIY